MLESYKNVKVRKAGQNSVGITIPFEVGFNDKDILRISQLNTEELNIKRIIKKDSV